MADVVELKYATWMVGGIWLGVVLFFVIAAFFFTMAFQALSQGSAFGLFVMAVVGGYMFYLAMVGTRLLPYLRCSIRVDESGFQLIWKDKTESYSWAQPLVTRNSSSTQILEVFDSNDNRIVAIDHKIGNFEAFRARLKQ